MTNKRNKLNISGISLIVLVITIIVIIIIAGAIILSLNNSGIIGKSTLARESNDFANIRQMVELEKANMLLTGQFNKEKIQIPNIYKDDIEITDTGKIILKNNDNTKITDISNAIEKLGASYLLDGFDYLETISSREFDSEKLAEYDYRNVAKIIIEGKSEQVQTVQGKNLIDVEKVEWLDGGINTSRPYLVLGSKTRVYSVSDEEVIAQNTASNYNGIGFYIPVTPGQTYSISKVLSWLNASGSTNIFWGLYSDLEDFTSTGIRAVNSCIQYNSSSAVPVITIPQGANYLVFALWIYDGTTAIKRVSLTNFQLELNNQVTSYEPFIPNRPSPDYPSSINSVENFDLMTKNVAEQIQTINFPYTLRSLPNGIKDYIEIDNVNKTAKLYTNVGEIILNGTEGLSPTALQVTGFFTGAKYVGNMSTVITQIRNSHFVWGGAASTSQNYACVMQGGTSSKYIYVRVPNSIAVTEADFKAWLSTNNVTFQYKLDTPIVTNLTYNEVQAYYPYTQIYTNAAVKPSIGAKVIVN